LVYLVIDDLLTRSVLLCDSNTNSPHKKKESPKPVPWRGRIRSFSSYKGVLDMPLPVTSYEGLDSRLVKVLNYLSVTWQSMYMIEIGRNFNIY
jgi:hypothetical protein